MHPNSLKNLRPYPPGTSGNTGRRSLPDGLRDIKSLTNLEVNKLVSKVARMNSQELTEYKSKNLSALEIAIVAIFLKSIKYGDYSRLSFLLDRCLGRLPTSIEDDEDKEEREALQKLSLKELLTLVKENLPDIPEAI